VPVASEPPPTTVWAEAFGGRRGMLDSALATVVFVAGNALAGLRVGLIAAIVTGAGLMVVRLARRQTPQQAFSGFFALALAAILAARTGHARDFFLPGIAVSVGFCVAALGSVLLRRPLVGVLAGALDGAELGRRGDPARVRAYTLATLGWAALFALRGGVQGLLYLQDAQVGWLAAARLVMGYPATVAAVALTVVYLRRTVRVRADSLNLS
jgi:hypothetical protein